MSICGGGSKPIGTKLPHHAQTLRPCRASLATCGMVPKQESKPARFAIHNQRRTTNLDSRSFNHRSKEKGLLFLSASKAANVSDCRMSS